MFVMFEVDWIFGCGAFVCLVCDKSDLGLSILGAFREWREYAEWLVIACRILLLVWVLWS